MIKLITGLFKKQTDNRSKDLNDYSKCDLSTNWKPDDYCANCGKSTGYKEFMSDICKGCGAFDTQILHGRSYRKVKVCGEWKYQIRYPSGLIELKDSLK